MLLTGIKTLDKFISENSYFIGIIAKPGDGKTSLLNQIRKNIIRKYSYADIHTLRCEGRCNLSYSNILNEIEDICKSNNSKKFFFIDDVTCVISDNIQLTDFNHKMREIINEYECYVLYTCNTITDRIVRLHNSVTCLDVVILITNHKKNKSKPRLFRKIWNYFFNGHEKIDLVILKNKHGDEVRIPCDLVIKENLVEFK